MKGYRQLSSIILGTILVCAVSTLGQGQERRQGVDGRSSIKSSVPPGADLTRAKTLSISDLVSLPEPPGVQKNDPRYEKMRIPAFTNPLGVKEGDIVKVSGWVHLVRLMGDGDYNLRFSPSADSADRYIVAEIPDQDDVPQQFRPTIKAARDFVQSKLLGAKAPSRQGTTLPNPAYVEITGQLFFNDVNVGNPPAPDAQGTKRGSNWEIHPGLALALSPNPRK